MNGFPPPTLKELEELVASMRSLNLGSEPPQASGARRSSGRLSYRLTPDMMRDIVRRYKAGEATTTMSEDYGVSRSSIASLLRKEGVVLRGQPMTKQATVQAVALYNQGLTIRQVAEQVGHSYGTVRAVLHRSGVQVSDKGVRRR